MKTLRDNADLARTKTDCDSLQTRNC